MKASVVLKEMDNKLEISTINEKDFDYLGLSSSVYNGVLCTFIDDEKYLESLLKRDAVILTTEEIGKKYKEVSAIYVNNPRISFFMMHNYLVKNNSQYNRDKFETYIGNNCNISNMAYIAENNVRIGNNVIIEEFVSIKPNSTIKDNVIIRSGSVIGGEGFEHKRSDNGVIPVTHAGGVIVGNDVEIQQNVCIDKAIYPWDNTVIGDGCKVDNLIHIAHAVKIGKEVLLAACTLVGGRVNIGDKVWIGPGVTIKNNVNIGENAIISIGSVVSKSVQANHHVSGNFAIDHDKFIGFIKSIR